MLDTLLESRAKARRPLAGALVSIAAHTAIIAAAVYATAQARIAAPVAATNPRIYFVPPVAQDPQFRDRQTRTAGSVRSRERPILKFFDVPTIDVNVPAVEMSHATTSPDDFGTAHLAGDDATGSLSATAGSGSAFSADQVEKQVSLQAGGAPPVYPTALRLAGIEGKVIATFVVNALGQAEDSTVRFESSDNKLFADAVRTALRRMRFVPAEVGGRKVRQLVQMPFVFTLQK